MRRLAAVAVIALSAVGASCGDDPYEPVGVSYDPLPSVAGAELPDLTADGEPFALVAPDDGLLLVYFGYTNCPDACPATLGEIDRALGELDSELADRVEVAMVTVDPEHDEPLLAEYVQSFVADAHALSTDDPRRLAEVADLFQVTYRIDDRAAGNIKVDHTTHLFAVDDEGDLVLVWTYPTAYDDIAADIEWLLS